jgi:hypothetical protein
MYTSSPQWQVIIQEMNDTPYFISFSALIKVNIQIIDKILLSSVYPAKPPLGA